jgi:hypothetical protein
MTEAGMDQRTGRCLCGAVTLRATAQPHVHACHCAMCRRWGGGPLLCISCGTDVRVEGGKVTRFRSSDWAERGFCARCGTHLFFFFVPDGSYFLPAGIFEDQSGLDFQTEIYVDRKPGYYDFAGERKRQTEADFLASVGAGGES